MEFTVKSTNITNMSAKGTIMASYNQLLQIFGKSPNQRWAITAKGHRFAIWLHKMKPQHADEILPWTIGGYGTGYEVSRCRKITGLPCFHAPEWSDLREKFGWSTSLDEIFEEIKDLSYGDQINAIYK